MRKYYYKQRGHSTVTFLLGYKIFCLAAVVIFDFKTQYIFGFFFLILSANYTTFLSLLHVMRNLELPECHAIRKKVHPYFMGMNIAYAATLVMALIPATAPVCSSLSIYPMSMFMCNILFLANTGFFMYCAFNNYLQTPDSEAASDEKSPLTLKGAEYIEKQRQIYTERMKSYGNYLKILSVLQIVIILLGRVFIDGGEYLACTGGGFQWISTSVSGDLFVAFLMVTIMMQSAMCEKFLYRIPNKYGMFESIKISPVKEHAHDHFRNKLGLDADNEDKATTAIN